MREWKEVLLGELIEIVNGFAFKSNNFLTEKVENSLPVIKIKNVASGQVTLNDVQYHIFDKNHERFLVERNDILIALTGNHPHTLTQVVGEVSLSKLDDKALLNQRVAKIKPKSKILNSFLYYFLKDDGTHDYLASQSAGSANQANISKKNIEDVPINLPSLSEQRAIASILSSLDDKIDLLHRQNKTLEQMAETLFRQWFVEEAEEGWGEVKVGDFVKTNVNTANKSYPYDLIQYLDTGSLTNGRIEAIQEIELSDAPSRAKRLVEHNDVLISTVRPNQKHYGIIKNPAKNLVVSTGFCVISCQDIDPHFIYLLLTSNEMTEHLHAIAEGSTSTYPSLKPSDIEAVEFLKPPQEKLSAFAEFAKKIWDKIDYNQIQISTLEKLRDTLLPKLLSGEIRLESI